MPKVALVYPYYRTRSPTEMLFPPLGSALLKAQLSARGVESSIFDCTFTTPRRTPRFSPLVRTRHHRDLFHDQHEPRVIPIADAARELLPASIIVAGGPLPTLYPEVSPGGVTRFSGARQTLPSPCSAPMSFLTAFPASAFSELPLAGYEGLSISDGGLRVENPAVFHGEEEIDSFPPPDRRDFDHSAYQAAWREADGTRTSPS